MITTTVVNVFDWVTFEQKDPNEYLTTMYSSNDAKKIKVQPFTFSSANNQLRFVEEEGKTVDLVCDAMNNCYRVMDTPHFTAELVKQ